MSNDPPVCVTTGLKRCKVVPGLKSGGVSPHSLGGRVLPTASDVKRIYTATDIAYKQGTVGFVARPHDGRPPQR